MSRYHHAHKVVSDIVHSQGPAFDVEEYRDEYERNQFLTTDDLYEDVELAMDHMEQGPVLWFSESIDPKLYLPPDFTVESCWQEDLQGGIDNFQNLVNWLEEREGAFDPGDMAQYNRGEMRSVYRLMWDFDFDTLGSDDWDKWGPHKWHPEDGEWARCRNIAHDIERYPVAIMVMGYRIDGAHRLAVAIHDRQRSYPALIGIPESDF